MKVSTKTDRQLIEYILHNIKYSNYAKELKHLHEIKFEKRTLSQKNREAFLLRKVRALKNLLHI